jgi:hypothetical protein
MKGDLYDRLRMALAGKPEKPKPGFRTTQQWSEKWKTNIRTTQRLIQAGVKQGIMTMQVYRIATARRGLLPVEHYAEKK